MTGHGPFRGRVHFESADLHPSALLLAWLSVVILVQFVNYAALAVLVLAVLLQRDLWGPWWAYVRRSRWLLLSLWLILAYNTPGEAWLDSAWAPTLEGMAEANLHAVRLVLMLGCLAWLFARLGSSGLLSGLWGLLRGGRRLGLDTERLVVRIALVLGNLATSTADRRHWRQMLERMPDPHLGASTVTIEQPIWQLRDHCLVALAWVSLLGAALA
jgi:hypothetical protein